MNEWEIKDALCEVGRRIWMRGYVASNDGNLSYRIDDNRVIATPTLISKGFMKPEDMVIIDMDGKQIGGFRKPTSELKFHLNIYKKRPDVRSVVHCHPPHATAFCVARCQLPKCILPEVEIFLGQIPIAPYATPGSVEFAKSIDPYIKDHSTFLLANHGTISFGADIFDAYYKTETVDQYCRILILASQIGDWKTLDFKSMSELFKIKEKLGIPEIRDLNKGLEEVCKPGVTPCQNINSNITKNEIKETNLDASKIEDVVREVLKSKGYKIS